MEPSISQNYVEGIGLGRSGQDGRGGENFKELTFCQTLDKNTGCPKKMVHSDIFTSGTVYEKKTTKQSIK